MSSVFMALSCSRLKPHQPATSAMQPWRLGTIVGLLTWDGIVCLWACMSSAKPWCAKWCARVSQLSYKILHKNAVYLAAMGSVPSDLAGKFMISLPLRLRLETRGHKMCCANNGQVSPPPRLMRLKCISSGQDGCGISMIHQTNGATGAMALTVKSLMGTVLQT